MKHKLLFALAGAFMMSMSAMAQWTAPTEPTLSDTNAETIEVGKSYYIKNVAAGQYITGSNSWSTQVSFTRAGINDTYSPALRLLVEERTESWGTGLALKLDGSFTVNGESGARSFNGTYLFRDGETSSFIDYNNQGKGTLWSFTKAENGYYRIQTMTGDPAFPDAATQYAGWDSTNGPIVVDEDGALLVNEETGAAGSTVVVFNMTGTEENENIDWIFIDPTDFLAQKELYKPRKDLYDLLMSTTELDFTVDTSAATAVYNNANATKAELEAAIASLKSTINKAKYADLFADASETNPIDVTEYVLENPDFEYRDEAGNLISNGVLPPGWTITITGQNCGQQNRTDTNASTGYSMTNFIEAWHPQSLGDGVIAQTIYGLPKGKYVLECDASACHDPANGDGSDIVGVNLFIEAGSNKATTRIGTPRLGVAHFSVTYVNDGSDVMTFGLEANGTNANWLSADNFHLTYYGETTKTQEQLSLEASIETADAMAPNIVGNDIEDASVFNINADVAAAFEQALTDANAALESTPEDMAAAKEALDAAIEAARASNETYKAYQKVYNDALITAQQLAESNQWPDLRDEITDFAEVDLTEAFNAGTLTEEGLEEAQGKVAQLIADYLNDPEKIQPGDNLTFLIVNPHFTTGTTANPTGWTINEGGLTELRTSTHNIEKYHDVGGVHCDISQTLHNMPAGVYDVTLQGFVRHDGGDTDLTWLYGGISKAYLISLNDDEDQMRDEPLFSAETTDHPALGDTNYDATGSAGYKCNGMTGAYYWFQETNNKLDNPEPYYTNHCKVILDEPGDLTIGIHCGSMND